MLAANLKAVMLRRGWTIKDVVAHGASRNVSLTNGTVGRVHAGTYTGMDKLVELAAALGYEPWQLLVPGFDPENPPQLGDPRAIEREIKRQVADQMALTRQKLVDLLPLSPDLDHPITDSPPPKPKVHKMSPGSKLPKAPPTPIPNKAK